MLLPRSSGHNEITERPKLTITYETQDTEPPEVAVTSPDGGEVWEKGMTDNSTRDATDDVSRE